MKINELTKGLIAGLFASLSMMIFIISFFSNVNLEDSIALMYEEKKLGGLISLGSLVNLPLFLLGMRKRKTNFSKGILIISILMVVIIAILKLI